MRVYDCVVFNDELDLLEIRLHELADVVDVFVICEGNFDFKGRRKPLHFLNNASRFEPFLDKIRHVGCVRGMPQQHPFIQRGEWDPRAWANEHYQRDRCWSAIGDATPDDIILLSDGDEIPAASAVRRLRDGFTSPVRICGRQHYYNFNRSFRSNDYHGWAAMTLASTRAAIGSAPASEFRKTYCAPLSTEPMGWHCTWFGGHWRVKLKEYIYNHPMAASLDDRIAEGDANGREAHHGWKLAYSDDLSTIPVYVQQNLPKFAHLFDEMCITTHGTLFDYPEV
jgi:beta-1,4-mannosyl-glycoprotein beta-1,4-N-acetylglucosaminyltransferase